MKLIDIAKRLNKSSKNEDWVDIEKLGYELNVDITDAEQDRIKCYWVGSWYCTDSIVGYKMYFFDDEPVAFSIQLGRKLDENFKWFSLESAMKVKEYLLTLVDLTIHVSTCDINEDIGEGFKIKFSSEILHDSMPTLNGEKVEIIETSENKPYGISTELKVRLSNGDEKHVDVEDLDFSFHIL